MMDNKELQILLDASKDKLDFAKKAVDIIKQKDQRIAELNKALQYIARESAMARTGEKPMDICMGSIGFMARQALKDGE